MLIGITYNILGEKQFLVQLCPPQTPTYKTSSMFSIPSKNIKIKMYRTVILPVVLYEGCETWSLKLRGEHRLRMFENGVLGKILGPKKDEVTEEWRKLLKEELYDLYCSPNIVLVIKSRMR